ncbi:Sodium/calcium exchanger membrane region [Dillenia turbinata]|uniref:Sodium/calcium exchanger membrane region n=1 Tax=Dillenia turbinata TaxID=194707 RepID=A0AAN8V4G1_9MAGN
MGEIFSTTNRKHLSLFLLSCLILGSHSSTSHIDIHVYEHNTVVSQLQTPSNGCKSLHHLSASIGKCSYIKSHEACQPIGYIPYLELFYCNFSPALGYILLILWLLTLFYLLGNTAAKYFCVSLEGLAKILKLSPNIAGVTLLALGNGAPDLFSGIVSFTGDGDDDVGLSSILGGAFFVSSVVVGIISIASNSRNLFVDRLSFIRDIIFFLFCLSCVFVIIIIGNITLWGSLSFLLLYLVYVFLISATSNLGNDKDRDAKAVASLPILPVIKNTDESGVPLLSYVGDDENLITIHDSDAQVGDCQDRTRCCGCAKHVLSGVLYFLELPLYLPRRLTIPVVSEERWSKPFAVISVTLAPLLLAFLWNSRETHMVSKTSIIIYIVGGSIGIIFGVLAFINTASSNPPRTCLLPWLAGGFFMSITWTYVTAKELISLLVSTGVIMGINPSILGLTVLAWGNSLGDLVANVTMAINGGQEGTQVALSGCYAGPMLNTVVSLGLSLVLSCWFNYPSKFIIPKDPSIYETLGFLTAGLLWSLVVLPKRNMKLDRSLGIGLLTIYLCFLSIRIARFIGVLEVHVSDSPLKPKWGF